MKLTLYTDASFCEVREVREVPRIKIPYRVGQYVVKMIQELDLTNTDQIFQAALGAEDHVTAVVRATFGLSDEDLDCVDLMELSDLAKEVVGFVLGKMAELGVSAGDDDPNVQTPATMD
jgi:hypothetical protein